MESILAAAGIPTAVLGLLVWQLKRRIERQEARQEAAEKAREEFETNLYESSLAAIALGEATAKAVQRIPDAHCMLCLPPSSTPQPITLMRSTMTSDLKMRA